MKSQDQKAFVTNEIFDKKMDEVVDAILKGMDHMVTTQKNELRGEIRAAKEEVKQEIKNEVGWVKGDINGLKADLSTVPNRAEFTKLKDKVDKFTSN